MIQRRVLPPPADHAPPEVPRLLGPSTLLENPRGLRGRTPAHDPGSASPSRQLLVTVLLGKAGSQLLPWKSLYGGGYRRQPGYRMDGTRCCVLGPLLRKVEPFAARSVPSHGHFLSGLTLSGNALPGHLGGPIARGFSGSTGSGPSAFAPTGLPGLGGASHAGAHHGSQPVAEGPREDSRGRCSGVCRQRDRDCGAAGGC